MEQSLKPIYEIMSLHNKLFPIAIGGISEKEGAMQLNGIGNSFTFIAGHLTSTRYFMAPLLGLNAECPFGDTFTESYDPHAEYPTVEEIGAVFEDITPKLMKQLENTDAAILKGDLPKPFPVEEQNVLSGISFLAEHESYHMGQLGYQRVQLGHTSVFDTMFADV